MKQSIKQTILDTGMTYFYTKHTFPKKQASKSPHRTTPKKPRLKQKHKHLTNRAYSHLKFKTQIQSLPF